MGDAMDVVALDSGGDAAATRALQMEGGSLPPRKRLLAGLKLNGLLSTSPPPAAVAEEGCCMGCSAVESSGLRRIKRGGVVLRLCSACTLLYTKHMFCPHCLAMYHDASLLDGEFLVCTKCRRSVHSECEMKHSGGKLPEASSYVCLDCVNRRQRELANGSGSGVGPALKKPRMHRDRPDGSRFVAPPRMKNDAGDAASSSPQEAAVMARNAATAARKLAAAAKANAAAKASASVRASAAAKAALEAAALAARAEASIRGELRRTRPRLEINVHSEPRRERSYKHEDGSRRPSVDDEELARQLHRVINSSPRISRSMTPMRRRAKPETPSSGVSNSSAETVRAEHQQHQQHHQHQQQQQQHHQFRQRPRSVTHKEFRRIESRVSRHEVSPIVDPPPPPPHEDLAVKSEAMDGVMGPDEASILFDALVEADGEGMHHVAADGAPDQRPDYLQEILEAAVLSDAAMFNDHDHTHHDHPHHDHPHHDLDTVRPELIAADTSSIHIEAPDTAPATLADEVAVMMPAAMEDEVAVTMPAAMEDEVAVTMPAAMEDEVAVTMPAAMEDEVAVTMPEDVQASDVLVTHEVTLEHDVHDVEMQEVTQEEPPSTRVEEESSAAAVQESTIEAIPSTVEDEVPSMGATEVEVPEPSMEPLDATEVEVLSLVEPLSATEGEVPPSMDEPSGATEVEVPPSMEEPSGATEVEVPPSMEEPSGATDVKVPPSMEEPLGATEVEAPPSMEEPSGAAEELEEVPSLLPLSAIPQLEIPSIEEHPGAALELEALAPVEEVTIKTEPTCQQSG